MRTRSKKILSVLVALFFATLVLEIVFFIYFSVRERRIVSAPELFNLSFYFYDVGPARSCTWGSTVKVHPHLGHQYDGDADCPNEFKNNYGLAGDDIELEKNKKFYNLLILGGSVAENLTVMSEKKVRIFEQRLNKLWKSPNGKPFRVINGSMSGGRQPMQAVSSLLFSHLADAAISIEGYNELSEFNTRQLLETPAPIWMDFQVQKKQLFLSLVLSGVSAWNHSLFFQGLKYSYTHYVVLYYFTGFFQKYWKRAFMKEQPYPPTPESWKGARKRAYYLKRYRDYLANIHSIYRRQGIPFMVFFQPMPHFYKKLTAEERMVAGRPNETSLYPQMTRFIDQVPQSEFAHSTLLRIYENRRETLYIDTIHTNKLGLRILGDEIARQFAKRYGWKSKNG